MKKSELSKFFQLRFAFVGVGIFFLIITIFSLLTLTDRHENEHNYIVDILGKQRLYSQTLTLQSNQIGLMYDALSSNIQIMPKPYLIEQINNIKDDMQKTLQSFNATLSEMNDGAFDYNSKQINIFNTKSDVFQDKIKLLNNEWAEFITAIQTITERSSHDLPFRTAIILINEKSDVILGLTQDFSNMALEYFTEEHHKFQRTYVIFILVLILICSWILYGTFRYIIEPYNVFYRGLKALGSGKSAPRKNDKNHQSPLMVEVEQTFAVMRDMVNLLGIINQGASFTDTIELIFNTFRSQIPYNYIGIATFTGYTGTMLQAYHGISDDTVTGLPTRLSERIVDIETTSLGAIMISGKPRVINDLEKYAAKQEVQDYTRILLEEGIKSSITLSLSINGKNLGFLFFSSTEKNVYTDRHVDFLRNIRNAIALSFEKSIFIDELVYSSTLALAKMAEAKDEDTADHLDRMKQYTVLLTKCIKDAKIYNDPITPDFLRAIERFSPMHDIGKVGIRDDVLKKPGKLDVKEMDHMRTHAQYGANVLKEAENNIARSGRTFFNMGITIAEGHHERWDGTGYPAQLAGENIPLEARIVSIADVLDALTTRRPYKEPFPFEQSIQMIVDGKGTQFDPLIINVFEESIPLFKEMYEGFTKEMPEVY